MMSQQSREDKPAFDNQSMQSLQRSINQQRTAGLANTPEKKQIRRLSDYSGEIVFEEEEEHD